MAVGVERIFSRTIETRRLFYTDYYGDGDSECFVSGQNIYAPKVVSKKECISHVQKRVDTRLRKLKKTEKGLTKLGLTDKIIDRLQNYYGMAIRSNVGDLDMMKKAIFAVLSHVCSSEKIITMCTVHLVLIAGWCTYQLDLTNTKLHKPGMGFPQEAIKHLKPIFSDLSDENLRRKCIHGKTQNQNQSFNGLIWRRTPKDRFVKMTTFELAVYDAVATLLIFDNVNIEKGYYTTLGCVTDDNKSRIQNVKWQSSDSVKTRRRYLRGQKKQKYLKVKFTLLAPFKDM